MGLLQEKPGIANVRSGQPRASREKRMTSGVLTRNFLAMQLLSEKDLAVFRGVDTWIFDLDNTLYPADCNLFAQIDQRMGAFISELMGVDLIEARRVQKDYYHRYGTTLSGLMHEHKLPPERFLDYVHDIDLSVVAASPELGTAIENLPGHKYIFTNGSRRHAERVAEKLGVLHHFEDIFDIVSGEYVPKPSPEAYDRFLKAHGLDGRSSAMFEDIPHNLEAPHALGMATVLVHSSYYDHPSQKKIKEWRALPPHIHHITENLIAFLNETLQEIADGAKSGKTIGGD
jgi:putative hydrolase of the HAD superfamily